MIIRKKLGAQNVSSSTNFFREEQQVDRSVFATANREVSTGWRRNG
jgi:hypothetical protein